MRLIYPLLCLSLLACSRNQDKAFLDFSRDFHKAKWQQYSLWAALEDQATFDSLLPIATPERCASDLAFTQVQLKALARFKPDRMTQPILFEYKKIKTFLEASLQNLQTDQIYRSDPSFYNLNEAFRELIQKSELPEGEKQELVQHWLRQLPAYYETAKANLNNVTDTQKTQLAITQQERLYAFLQQKTTSPFQIKNPQIVLQAQLAQKDYLAYLISLQFEFGDTTMIQDRAHANQ